MRLAARVFALLVSLYAACTAAALGSVVYVNAAATGSNSGASWANAYTSLQSGLAGVGAGDEIWVAAASYKPTATSDRTVSFAMKDGVAVYGGFNGTETQRSQRNPVANVTVLSGDTVQWRNTSFITHSVTADPRRAKKPDDVRLPPNVAPFDSADIAAGQVYTRSFTIPGTYRYFCTHHEDDGMVGTVVVKPAP